MASTEYHTYLVEIVNALMPRGIRMAATDNPQDSIINKVQLVMPSGSETVAPSATEIAVVIMLDKDKLDTLGVRAHSERVEDGTLPS